VAALCGGKDNCRFGVAQPCVTDSVVYPTAISVVSTRERDEEPFYAHVAVWLALPLRSQCVVKQSCPRNACRVTLSPWFDVWMITGSKDCTTDVRDCFRWRTPSSSGRQCRLRLLTLASASPLPPVGYTASARSSSSLFIYRTETPYT